MKILKFVNKDKYNIHIFESNTISAYVYYDSNMTNYRLSVVNRDDKNLFSNLLSEIVFNESEVEKILNAYGFKTKGRIADKLVIEKTRKPSSLRVTHHCTNIDDQDFT
jgi:hypothetical protein